MIAPWNFPLAIATGMTAAALAAGNAVVLKPAEQSPACALMLVEALRGAGLPRDALSLVPGFGDAGAALVGDPRVHTIAFTGSAAVGLEIIRSAAETPDGQGHVKRVVAEMGGKNCVIVDSDADLDEVVPAVVHSAFGFAGQKCSAAARVLAHEAVHDGLVERLAGAVEVLDVGQAERFATEVPPVIDSEARERVRGYAEEAAAKGQIAAQAGAPEGGWFCPPTLASGLDTEARVLREEVFGPLLTVEPVESVEAACEVVDVAAGGAHRRPVLPQPGHRGGGGRPDPGRQPLREPRHHRRDGGPPALRRQPPLGHRGEGGRARLPAAVHRAAGGHREHHAPRARCGVKLRACR